MGVLPQVIPRFIGFCAYQLDSHLRNSALVGLVGGDARSSRVDDFFFESSSLQPFWWSVIFSENRYPLFGIMP